MKTYCCMNCGNTCTWGRSKVNKFCSNKCQGEYRWKTEVVPRIIRGECRDSGTLKRYLVETCGEKCIICSLSAEWQGKPLTLQLDHTDGNSDNNSLDNLRLLCPNCHTQTDTFGAKGMGNRYKKVAKRNVYLQAYKTTPR